MSGSRWCVYEDRVSGQSARVVVDDRGQPRPHRLAAYVSDDEIELRVIRLPDCVWTACTMAMHQLKLIAEARRTFMSQRRQGRIDPSDDGVHGAVRRRRPFPLFAKCENTPIDGGGACLIKLVRQIFSHEARQRYNSMPKILIGYARYSTDKQDLTAQREALAELGVAADRIYVDHG